MCEFETRNPSSLSKHLKLHSDEHVKYRKNEERRIRNVLNEHPDLYIFYNQEHVVDYKCINDYDNNCSRVDFYVEKEDFDWKRGIIFLEIDEYAHRHYPDTCDTTRMSKIHESIIIGGNELPVIFIRYNPNFFYYYTNTVKRKNEVRKSWREEQLIKYIRNIKFEKPLGIKYMFYDLNEYGILKILENYNETLKECIID